MQPNQQNQQPNSPGATNAYESPSGSAVPGYLHMDPIATPVSKKGRVKRILWTLLGLLISAGVIGAFLYWFLVVNSPQERFYRALEKTMETQYVSREYKISTLDSSPGINIKSQSNFEDQSSAITSVIYEMPDTTRKSSLKGEQIIQRGETSFAKLLQASKTVVYTPGEWYSIEQRDVTASIFDPMKLRYELNAPLGLVSFGIVSPSKRSQLVTDLKSLVTYSIKESKQQVESGEQFEVYNGTVDSEKLTQVLELYAKDDALLLPRDLLSTKYLKPEVEFWVSRKTGSIQKVTYATNPGYSNPSFKAEVIIKTIENPDIQTPNAKEL